MLVWKLTYLEKQGIASEALTSPGALCRWVEVTRAAECRTGENCRLKLDYRFQDDTMAYPISLRGT